MEYDNGKILLLCFEASGKVLFCVLKQPDFLWLQSQWRDLVALWLFYLNQTKFTMTLIFKYYCDFKVSEGICFYCDGKVIQNETKFTAKFFFWFYCDGKIKRDQTKFIISFIFWFYLQANENQCFNVTGKSNGTKLNLPLHFFWFYLQANENKCSSLNVACCTYNWKQEKNIVFRKKKYKKKILQLKTRKKKLLNVLCTAN